MRSRSMRARRNSTAALPRGSTASSSASWSTGDAQRFYDEGEDTWPKRYAIWGRLVAQQPGQIAYSIIDAKSIRLFMPSIFPAIEAQQHRRAWRPSFGLDPAALDEDRLRIQCRGAARHLRSHRARRLRAPKACAVPKSHWARAIDTAAVLCLSAAARHHLHLSRRQGERGVAHA